MTTNPIDRAALTLAGLLAGDDLDVLTRLAVAAALATLDDVQPPPPPFPEVIDPVPAVVGLPRALAQLREAVAAAPDVDDALRAGLAASYLLETPAPPDGWEPAGGPT